MCSYFNHNPLTDLMILLMLLAKLVYADGSENLYLKSSIQNIPSFPYTAQKRNDFFLKAGKSVPRIGRRNDDNTKGSSYRLVPQIESFDKTLTNTGAHQVNRRRNDFLFSKTIPRVGRRNGIPMNDAQDISNLIKKRYGIAPMDQTEEAAAAWPWFRNPELFSPYQKKSDNNFPDYRSWEDDADFVEESSRESSLKLAQCLRSCCASGINDEKYYPNDEEE